MGLLFASAGVTQLNATASSRAGLDVQGNQAFGDTATRLFFNGGATKAATWNIPEQPRLRGQPGALSVDASTSLTVQGNGAATKVHLSGGGAGFFNNAALSTCWNAATSSCQPQPRRLPLSTDRAGVSNTLARPRVIGPKTVSPR